MRVHEREVDAIDTLVDQWHHARARHGPTQAAMIARDNYTRELTNRAARGRLQRARELPADGVTIGGRGYVQGDRVIARRNDRHHELDNGTLGTIVTIDAMTGSMIIETDSGQPRALDAGYAAQHLEHAYALTAHGAQGGTFKWAGVIGRPAEFTREWAYTALSRARSQTTIHLIAEPHERERARDQYAPPEPSRAVSRLVDALRKSMCRSEHERLALMHAGETGPFRPEPSSSRLTHQPQPLHQPPHPLSAASRSQPSPPSADTPLTEESSERPCTPEPSRLKGLQQLRRLAHGRRAAGRRM
jgi:hypothetical protein